MAAMTVADYLLQRLREWGVEKIFGFPGDGINGLLAAWGRAENSPKFVQARHEEMSAFEAVGYAKFTTACMTRSSTTSRCWRLSGRPAALRWAAPTSRKSTC